MSSTMRWKPPGSRIHDWRSRTRKALLSRGRARLRTHSHRFILRLVPRFPLRIGSRLAFGADANVIDGRKDFINRPSAPCGLDSCALLIDAARMLNGPAINLVVVSEDAGKMAGIITKTDVVGRISQCAGCSCTMAAAEVIATKVPSCRPDDWLKDVWTTIKDRSLKNVPVVDQNRRLVFLTPGTFFSRFSKKQYEEQLLRDYVMCRVSLSKSRNKASRPDYA